MNGFGPILYFHYGDKVRPVLHADETLHMIIWGTVVAVAAALWFQRHWSPNIRRWLVWALLVGITMGLWSGGLYGQEYTNGIGGGMTVDTNANTITTIAGQTYGIQTPLGAFWLGFALVCGFMVFGWALRLVKFVGHSGTS